MSKVKEWQIKIPFKEIEVATENFKTLIGRARGLDHLHRHVGGYKTRDIKSSNILIDENWVGKISDLGLSKLGVSGVGMSVIISNGCGTQGYCEPEYFSTGFVTTKSDVFSFVVVLFEVLCGRLCLIDRDDRFTLSSVSAKKYYKKNSLDTIIDHSLKEHIGSYSMTKFAAITYRCLHNDREKRPAMDVVAKELEEALRSLGRSQWEGWRVLGHPQQWRTYPMNKWFPRMPPNTETMDIGSAESFQYKFSTVQAATKDFSEDNELGQGWKRNSSKEVKRTTVFKQAKPSKIFLALPGKDGKMGRPKI
uniref:Serine-threonine/tyrosine-protein kinase catalytic domain-containing protein n=1 Tax=Tanacetum cinerariifolium TaxID=118510 RepID=A0A699K4M9_TANCI|nr:serine-threonine/tyrosine-protein kinase catalytic domain-containing protein [Tanacetum cinerariifolium]